MSNFSCDQETIAGLDKLLYLIEDGLARAWDPTVVRDAKQQITEARLHFQEAVQEANNQIELIQLHIDKLKSQQEQLFVGIETVTRFQETLESWGGVDQLREELSNLEEVDELVKKIVLGQEIAQQVQRQTEAIQLEAEQLNGSLASLGGVENLNRKFSQVGEIASVLSNLDHQIQMIINQHMESFMPQFEDGKSQIQYWKSRVISSTSQTLELVRGTCKTVENLAFKVHQDIDLVNSELRELHARENRLKKILLAIETISDELGEERIDDFSGQLQSLESLIQSEKQDFQAFRQNLHMECHDIVLQKTDEMQREVRQELNFLKQELAHVKANKCDRPFWSILNWKRPKPKLYKL
jgi:hypothetical protein